MRVYTSYPEYVQTTPQQANINGPHTLSQSLYRMLDLEVVLGFSQLKVYFLDALALVGPQSRAVFVR